MNKSLIRHALLLVLCIFSVGFCQAGKVEVIMAGVGGNSSAQMLNRIDSDVLAHKPSTVLVLAGTNDMLNSGKLATMEQFDANLRSIVNQILDINSEVLLMTVPPCVEEALLSRHDAAAYAPDGPNGRVVLANQVIAKIASEKNLVLVDMYKLFNEDMSLIRSDGVHPTDLGYAKMAALLNDSMVANNLPASKVVCFGNSITTHYPDYLRPLLERSFCGGFDAFSTIEAEDYCIQVGLETEECSEGTLNVGWINTNDWCYYKAIDLSDAKSLDVRVSSTVNNSSIEVRVDAANGPLLGTVSVPNTKGNQNWTSTGINITEVTGVHDLFLIFKGGSGYLLNLNWFRFSKEEINTGLSSELILSEDIFIYPNPVQSHFKFDLKNEKYEMFCLLDLNGKQLLHQHIAYGENQLNVDMRSFPLGIYVLVLSGEADQKSIQLIKE